MLEINCEQQPVHTYGPKLSFEIMLEKSALPTLVDCAANDAVERAAIEEAENRFTLLIGLSASQY